jgi:mannose-6-phosphate isomerase-like protein (cupin superfamily)
MQGIIQAKVWGTTQCLFQSETTEVHLIRPTRGGFCSIHEHASKNNLFYVIAGKLKVVIFRENNLKDETILGPGMGTTVAPQERHQFEALDDTIALEIYHVRLDPADIQRFSQGGLATATSDADVLVQRNSLPAEDSIP